MNRREFLGLASATVGLAVLPAALIGATRPSKFGRLNRATPNARLYKIYFNGELMEGVVVEADDSAGYIDTLMLKGAPDDRPTSFRRVDRPFVPPYRLYPRVPTATGFKRQEVNGSYAVIKRFYGNVRIERP